ncbi:hypothetical protein N7467_001594 [Penicillium canescens]|nr:hypothetical protein N7467_001594 [Penicillium canescens]
MRPETFQRVLESKETLVNLSGKDGKTALFLAVQNGDLNVLECLRKAGAEIDWKDNEYRTPLSHAAQLGCRKTVEFLVEEGNADADSKDDKQHTPLQWAILGGHTDIIRYFVTKGVDVNHGDHSGQTPLLMLLGSDLSGFSHSDSKKEGIINLFIEHKADVNRPNTQGRTPFSLAAERLRVEIMRMLIERGANPHQEDKNRHTAFWWFLKARSGRSVVYIDPGQTTPKVPHDGLAKLMESLKQKDPNKQDSTGRTWLSWAAEYGDEQIVKSLLGYEQTDPNYCDRGERNERKFARTPVLWAVEKHHEGLVRWMIANKKNDFSLNYVIRNFHILREELGTDKALHIIKTFISYGEVGGLCLTGRTDLEAKTPLYLACRQENQEIADALLKGGADPNPRDSQNQSCLQYALGLRNKVITKRLLRSMSVLEHVQSSDWFHITEKNTRWIQVYELAAPGSGFDFELELPSDLQLDQLLSEESLSI